MTTVQLNHQTAFKMHLVADGGVQPSCACTVGILLTVLHVYSHVLMDSKQYIKPADATSQHITKGEKKSQFIFSATTHVVDCCIHRLMAICAYG